MNVIFYPFNEDNIIDQGVGFKVPKNLVTDKFALFHNAQYDIATSNYLHWFENKEVTKWNSHGLLPKTKKEFNSYIKSCSIESNTPDKIVYAIIAEEEVYSTFPKFKLSHIGNVSLQRIDWINRSAEFAIVIGESLYHNQGIGKKAIEFMLKKGFDDLGLNRIWTGTVEKNIGMQKLANNAGMIQEGIFKEGVYLHGEFLDVFCYRILQSEYYQKRGRE